MSNITPKQKRFCEEYLVDLNAAAAYRRAGYKAKTDSVATSSAHKLLMNADIQARISELMQARSEATGVTAARVVEELEKIAFSRITDVVDVNGGEVRIKDSREWSDRAKASVKTVKATTVTTEDSTTYRTEFTQYDKMRALELLAKHTGLTNEYALAIATLKTYGIDIKRGADGRHYIDEET